LETIGFISERGQPYLISAVWGAGPDEIAEKMMNDGFACIDLAGVIFVCERESTIMVLMDRAYSRDEICREFIT